MKLTLLFDSDMYIIYTNFPEYLSAIFSDVFVSDLSHYTLHVWTFILFDLFYIIHNYQMYWLPNLSNLKGPATPMAPPRRLNGQSSECLSVRGRCKICKTFKCVCLQKWHREVSLTASLWRISSVITTSYDLLVWNFHIHMFQVKHW